VAEVPPAGPDAALVSGGPGRLFVEPVSDLELAGLADPQQQVVRREEISLAFVAALQRLAPRQRAALLLHDVLGFAHAEVAQVLQVSPGAVQPAPGPGTRWSKPWAPPADPASPRSGNCSIATCGPGSWPTSPGSSRSWPTTSACRCRRC
jgi:hypothetical protein